MIMVAVSRQAIRSEEQVFVPEPAAKAAPKRFFPSPTADARALQAQARAFAEAGSIDTDKWSARRRLVFIVGTTLLMWGAMFAVGWAVFRAIG